MNKLNEIYTNPANPGAFSGLSGLSLALKDKKIKVTKAELIIFLIIKKHIVYTNKKEKIIHENK